MTHARLAPLMGLATGVMIPAMVHGSLASAGLAFAAAHLTVARALGALVLLVSHARAWAARHRPSHAMLARMALGAAAGFALICTHCLVTWHGAAEWS